MRKKEAKTVQRRMWFGMNATVIIGPGFIHKAGFSKILLPHPPVINWLLRQRLTDEARYPLSFTHEFGHLQTVPLAVLYTGVMLALASVTGHTGLLEIVLVLISTHAAWEITAEIYTIASNVHLYRKYYEKITLIPRAIFWIITGAFAVTGWFVIFF
ncbi:MAG: hypothetical protein ABFR82_10660 [Nitrospirota bacterium]